MREWQPISTAPRDRVVWISGGPVRNKGGREVVMATKVHIGAAMSSWGCPPDQWEHYGDEDGWLIHSEHYAGWYMHPTMWCEIAEDQLPPPIPEDAEWLRSLKIEVSPLNLLAGQWQKVETEI